MMSDQPPRPDLPPPPHGAPPPPPPPPPAAAPQPAQQWQTPPPPGPWTIREGGKNGTLHIEGPTLVRTIKKSLGKNDRQVIPFRSVTAIHHDRKTLGTDVVTLHTSHQRYEWRVKSSAAAEQMVAVVQSQLT